MRNKGLIIDDIRNRGNKELSKRASCSVHQGTKVGSAEERNQVTSTPHRVRPDFSNTLPRKSWSPISPKKAQYSPSKSAILSPSRVNLLSALRKFGIPGRSKHSPAEYRHSSASIPGSLDLRLIPGGIPDTPVESFSSTVRKFPQEI